MTLIQLKQIQNDPSLGASGQYLLTLIPSINGISGGNIEISGVSPISVLTNGENITISGNFNSYIQGSQTGIFLTTFQSGLFYPASNPSNFITSTQSGNLNSAFYPLNSNPSGYVTGLSGNYYSNTNPSGFIPSGNLIAGSGVSINQSGNYLVFTASGNGGGGTGGTGIYITGLTPYNITVSGSYTIPLPSGAFLDGSRVVYRLTQDTSGNHTISLSSGYRIPKSSTNPLPFSTSGNFMDIFAAMYNQPASLWDVVSFVPGYN